MSAVTPYTHPPANVSPVGHLKDGSKHRLFHSGSESLIHNVTFIEERETSRAWSSLVHIWLQVRVGPWPIVTVDQMASVNTFNQRRVSAQRCPQTQSGRPVRPYSNRRPAVRFEQHFKASAYFPPVPPHPTTM